VTLPPGPHRPERRRLAASCPLIHAPKLGGRPAVSSVANWYRDAVWLRAGCAWRLLPHDLPPGQSVYHDLRSVPASCGAPAPDSASGFARRARVIDGASSPITAYWRRPLTIAR
jgi:hypothetical protein